MIVLVAGFIMIGFVLYWIIRAESNRASYNHIIRPSADPIWYVNTTTYNNHKKEDDMDEAKERDENPDVMRQAYRELNETEKAKLAAIKNKGVELWQMIDDLVGDAPDPSEVSHAKANVEEAIVWAVKYLTG